MSENKTYINGVSLKKVEFKSGGSIVKFSGKVDALIDQLRQHGKSNGYFNFAISARKTPGKYGETHCMWVDTWEPSQRSEPDRKPTPPAPWERSAAEPKSDNLPF